MSFELPSRKMKGLVGEASPDFYKTAPKEMIAASKRAERTTHITSGQVLKDLGGKEEVRAKYKIEVTFVKNRTSRGLNAVGVQIWESGKRFHGGGDEMMFWCKDSRKGQDGGCWGPIPGDNIKAGVAYCPSCKKAMNADLLTNMKLGNVYMDTLSKELEVIFRQLDGDADLFLKFHKTDIRYIAMVKAKGSLVAERLKGMSIYPLKNILKDISSGADLAGRFKAFLTS